MWVVATFGLKWMCGRIISAQMEQNALRLLTVTFLSRLYLYPIVRGTMIALVGMRSENIRFMAQGYPVDIFRRYVHLKILAHRVSV